MHMSSYWAREQAMAKEFMDAIQGIQSKIGTIMNRFFDIG